MPQNISALNLDLHGWSNDWVNRVFDMVWEAYDLLQTYYENNGIKFEDESEDEITFALLRQIDKVRDYSPANFRIIKFHNQPPDKSKPRNRKRNTNDIGVFIDSEIEKPVLIFESKKISRFTENGIKSYIEDLEAFLNGDYGSHLSESGLIAYSNSNTQNIFFEVLVKCLRRKLYPVSHSSERSHKVSKHKKKEGLMPRNFVCHHLFFVLP